MRGRRLLLVGLDLWARGNAPDSWEETRRRVEAAAIRDAITRTLGRLDSAKSPVDGVVVGGDMNLVAGRAPLDSLGRDHPRRAHHARARAATGGRLLAPPSGGGRLRVALTHALPVRALTGFSVHASVT